jgi:hypothetical protein
VLLDILLLLLLFSLIIHLHWDKNKAKFQAVKEAGYNFKLEVR